MNQLWKKFDRLSEECCSNMISFDPNKDVWNRTFEVLVSVIEKERETNPRFGREIDLVDDDLDYEVDVSGWLKDYTDELGMYHLYEKLYDVCETLLALFEWKETSPADIKFQMAEALSGQGKDREAVEFCRKWIEEEKDGDEESAEVSELALIYALIHAGEYPEAQEMTEKRLAGSEMCTEENERYWHAAVKLYEAMGDEKKAAWMKREEEKYEEMIFHQLADDFYDEDFPLEDDELPF